MSLELILQSKIDPEEEKKKIAAWAGYGKQLYRSELSFQLRGQDITSKLIEPETEDQILAAEQALATVKKELKTLINDRITVTARFDPVANRLMQPEKDAAAAISKTEAAIIKAKQAAKESAKRREEKEKELKSIAEYVRVYIADMHSAILNSMAKLITDAYKHAIKVGITIEALPEYLVKVRARITVANTTTPVPKPPFKFNTQAEIDAEVALHFNPWTPQQYIDGFNIDLDKKFTDWQLALKNPEQATQLNEQEYETTVTAIADNKEREVVGAKLDNIAMPVSTVSGIKDLKERWVLEEPDTIEKALVVINAFSVNRALCIPELNQIKPVNLGVKQMIAALQDVKNKDENFEVTGLTFKKIEKL